MCAHVCVVYFQNKHALILLKREMLWIGLGLHIVLNIIECAYFLYVHVYVTNQKAKTLIPHASFCHSCATKISLIH